MKTSRFLLVLAALSLPARPLAAADPSKEEPEKRPVLYQNDFAKDGNARDPLDADNPCFLIGSLHIPHAKLPRGEQLELTLRVYCEVFGRAPDWDPDGPGRLQLDVTSDRRTRRISQCRFPTGKAWVTARIPFSVTDSTADITIYNKWTNEPVFVDNITIRAAAKVEKKAEDPPE